MKIIRRRRKENKTNYTKRIKLLKGEKPRIVFRKTNKYFIAQYVLSEEAQDTIKITLSSKKLLDYGWPKELQNSLRSMPAAYLLGFLIAKNITDKKNVVVDTGMIRIIHKNTFYSFLKGLIDSGMGVSCKDEAFPSNERIEGKHLKKDFSTHFKQIKEKIQK